jgi:hypothetical protein
VVAREYPPALLPEICQEPILVTGEGQRRLLVAYLAEIRIDDQRPQLKAGILYLIAPADQGV